MSDHDHSGHKSQPSGSFWMSRTGVVLIAFLAVAGLLLVYEHRAHLFTGNEILIGLLACQATRWLPRKKEMSRVKENRSNCADVDLFFGCPCSNALRQLSVLR